MAHLLVVDDELSARTTLALLLRKRGHRVVEADGVTAATKRLPEEVFDLVVLGSGPGGEKGAAQSLELPVQASAIHHDQLAAAAASSACMAYLWATNQAASEPAMSSRRKL